MKWIISFQGDRIPLRKICHPKHSFPPRTCATGIVNMIALSYMWMEPTHPDPQGTTFRLYRGLLSIFCKIIKTNFAKRFMRDGGSFGITHLSTNMTVQPENNATNNRTNCFGRDLMLFHSSIPIKIKQSLQSPPVLQWTQFQGILGARLAVFRVLHGVPCEGIQRCV